MCVFGIMYAHEVKSVTTTSTRMRRSRMSICVNAMYTVMIWRKDEYRKNRLVMAMEVA